MLCSESGHGETATVGVYINSGSRNETAETSGTAHFLEHMTFKGTAKMNQRALEERFENMGGHLNAYTSREHTVYFARVFKSDVPEALNILADMLTAPKLDEGAIERERHVILREMEEVNQQTVRVVVVVFSLSLSLSLFLSLPLSHALYSPAQRPPGTALWPHPLHPSTLTLHPPRSCALKQNTQFFYRPPPSPPQEELIFDLLHETAYPSSGLGRTILGPEANIRSISRKNLEDYIKTNYVGPRIVVAGAGAVEHASLTKLANAAFGALPSQPPAELAAAARAAAASPPVFVGSQLKLRNDDLGLAHLAIAFETGGWTHPSAFPLMVMEMLLGAWDRTKGAGPNMASALGRKVGEGNLAHSVSTFNTKYAETGMFGVYAVADPQTVWELSSEVCYEMVRLCHAVTEEEVERAKTQLKTTLLGGLDGTTAVCEDIGRQVLTYGRRMTPAEVMLRIDAVDARAVMAVARAYIDDKECVTAGAGAIHEMPDASWYRRRTYRLTV